MQEGWKEPDDKGLWAMLPEALKENFADDPFSSMLYVIKEALELALDDGMSGKMNDHEYTLLEKIAVLVEQEGGMPVEPRMG